MDVQTFGQHTPQEIEQAIMTWLQQNAIPVQHLEARRDFSDLQPLKTLLKDAKVVGLGETTHGTREFVQLKHRLLEFLVTEMNITALALEASFAACQPINDYVLYGTGDRATVLTGQGYALWDTEEFADMLDWLRTYNQSVPEDKRVKFYGVDLWRNDIGRQAVLDYLRKVAPDRLTATESLFKVLAQEETKWPMRIDEETEKTLRQLLPQLQDLIDHFAVNKDLLLSKSPLDEFDQTLQYLQVMKQWLIANTTDLLPPGQATSARTRAMAENVMYLVDHARPEEKFVVWAHNEHINLEGLLSREPNLGYYLREKYAHGYFAVGFEFGEGAFLSRTVLPEKLLGPLKEVTLPPPLAGSLPWYLSRTNMGILIMNLHVPADNPVVEQWLQTPQLVHNAGWAYDEKFHYYQEWSIAKKYDGLVFIDKTTATRPTVNALRIASNALRTGSNKEGA